jgi:hypothetical protein
MHRVVALGLFMGVYYFYGLRPGVELRYVLSDGLGPPVPPADLVPNRLCRGATVCFGCILTQSLSSSAAEYFHLVAPGPVLGRIPKKGRASKEEDVRTRCVTTSIHMASN